MKIGILTYHRTLNHGACLQAVATRLLLEDMGHTVYYVDYWPKYHANSYKLFSFKRFFGMNLSDKINYLIRLKTFRNFKCRENAFFSFHEKYILPFCRDISEEYDIVLYGSDQIWREQKSLGGYNPVYFADDTIKASKKVSFSASMGKLPSTESKKQELKRLFSNFSRISVREEDLKRLLSELGYDEATLTLDPTLLLSKSRWMQALNIKSNTKERYVLIYGIGKTGFCMSDIEMYAKEHNCAIRTLYSSALYKDDENNISAISPSDFVEQINNAECVFTSSFHGLAFSIILGKEFYASFNKNPSRAKTLLKRLGIMERYSEPFTHLKKQERINYFDVNEKLSKERQKTIEFLKSIFE